MQIFLQKVLHRRKEILTLESCHQVSVSAQAEIDRLLASAYQPLLVQGYHPLHR